MSKFPLNQSAQIFREVAEAFGDAPITDQNKILSLFAELDTRLGGLVILDFLDMSNWDKIEAYRIDPSTGMLTLTWHDYRAIAESADAKEMRQMVFPASLYSCALQINSIVPIVRDALNNRSPNGVAVG